MYISESAVFDLCPVLPTRCPTLAETESLLVLKEKKGLFHFTCFISRLVLYLYWSSAWQQDSPCDMETRDNALAQAPASSLITNVAS